MTNWLTLLFINFFSQFVILFFESLNQLFVNLGKFFYFLFSVFDE